MNFARTLTKWLAPAVALFALACALLAPAEAGSPRRHHSLAQNVQVQAVESKQDETPDNSTVRGRVVYDDTTRPVRRARVMLITEGGSGRNEYAALTDSRGDFLFRGVRVGTYYAFADVPGVLSPVGFISVDDMRGASGMPDLGEGRKYFDMVEVDGKQDLTVTVHARRGASIGGRVSYADGDPAVNVTLSLMRRGADDRMQRYLTGASIVSLSGLRTDDRGMFRVTGLPPGEYLVGVNESINHGTEGSNVGSMGEDLSGMFRGIFTQQLLMTFYPSTTNLKEAGVIKVAAGDERADIDITIPDLELRTIAGVVRARRGGRPVAHARVSITRRDDPLAPSRPASAYYDSSEYGPNGTLTDEEGRWQLKEIPDGAYIINVKPPEEYETASDVAVVVDTASANTNVVAATNMNANGTYNPPRRKHSYAPTHRNLDVSGDVSEFVVEVADGGRIAGTISIEGGATPRYGRISVTRLDEGVTVLDASATNSAGVDGGRFAVEGLAAGKFVIHPTIGGADDRIYLKSMTWNGKDLLREPLELAEGASAEGVRIVYARNPATLNVTVRGAVGKRLHNAFVYLLPADLSTWSPSGQSLYCVTDEANVCSITAPPGDYRVLTLQKAALAGAFEQEVRRRAPAAPRITLREGETRRMEVDAPDN
ncbi:MAG: hypothetical protein ACJ74T_18370 [Pyrinomonadaceae bacterium]